MEPGGPGVSFSVRDFVLPRERSWSDDRPLRNQGVPVASEYKSKPAPYFLAKTFPRPPTETLNPNRDASFKP